jgi:alkaline phosphatase D
MPPTRHPGVTLHLRTCRPPGDSTPYGPYYAPMIPHNPHIKYYEGDKRGYFKARVTRKRMALDLRFVTSVERPDGAGYTEKSFVVEDGEPGAHSA